MMAQTDRLLVLCKRLSPGDREALEGCIGGSRSLLVAPPRSAVDRLLSELAAIGWAEREADRQMPGGSLSAYRLTIRGLRGLPMILGGGAPRRSLDPAGAGFGVQAGVARRAT